MTEATKKLRLSWLTINSSYSHSSLALPILHQFCADVAGVEWRRVDALTQDEPFAVARQVAAQQPDIVAAPLYLFNRNTALDVLARLKALRPELVIMAGGPECLGEGAGQLLRSRPEIDYAISGEGEEPLRALLLALTTGGDTAGIAGVSRQADGMGTAPPTACVHHGWLTEPPPAADAFFRTDKPFVQVETSRGCPFGCQYCTSAKTTVRYQPLEAVRRQLELLRERGVREIRLLDRTFNTPEARCVSLLRMFRQEYPEMRFHLEIHPQFLTPAIREELSQANPRQLHVEAGIQTLHNEVLQAVGRPPQAELALDGLRFLVSCHPLFDTHCDLLAGLPRQTLAGLREDLQRLMTVHPAEIQLEVLKILPGTLLKHRAAEAGIRFAPQTPYDVMQTREMSVEDIAEARQLSRLTDLFYNHPLLTEATYTAVGERAGFVDALHRHLLAHTEMLTAQTPSLDARLKLLRAFCGAEWPEAAFEVDKAWLRLANTAGKAGQPAAQAVPLETLPDGAVLVQGEGERALTTAGTRLWLLPHAVHPAVFACNRAIYPNRAVAEWRLEK